ncbi:MAG: PIG-L family deacetylase [Muribaculaceae bacterium]|nr:PIG-L family deacetylase [Muribaculaceae bacterium]
MEKHQKTIMVIAPHADDEVLGCGGYLLHQVKQGARVVVVLGTIGGVNERQNFEMRLAEATQVNKKLGSELFYLFKNKDAMLDTVPSLEITAKLDRYIEQYRPDEIFINYRSRHQDHIKMYDCAMASMRLKEGYMPKLIALYEYPFVSDGLDIVRGGKIYHDITDNIDEKVALFNLYASQVKDAPSPLNESGIKSLASIRGLECGMKYAEMFYVQKMIL